MARHLSSRTARIALAFVIVVVAVVAMGVVSRARSDHAPLLDPGPVSLPDGSPRYVVLGDSYSAGEGLRPFLSDTVDLPRGDRCHRSTSAFAQLLVFEPVATIDFRACSGGKVEHLYDEVQTHGGRPVSLGLQARDVLADDVGLVTLTMGGNDVGFARVVRFCAERPSCTDDRFLGSPSLEDWAERALEDLADELPLAYRQLRVDAPNARIVVIGYPRLFSERSSNSPTCILYRNLFKSGERQRLNSLTMRLNRVVESSARAAGLEYLDVSYVFAGHETCAADGAWLQFLGRNPFFQDGNFHPTWTGQRMIARTLACYLTVHRERPAVEDDVLSVATVPPGDAPLEEQQASGTNRSHGDLGDAIYDCANGVATTENLDRREPPVVSPQAYPPLAVGED